ncbi:MAG TPA: efflux RND transporter periplasmic adaptor subunit [Halothiobacillus sp.]|nr:efflux RND transporter periplasmic adaptor subunit [Halothiobacillus sp.]
MEGLRCVYPTTSYGLGLILMVLGIGLSGCQDQASSAKTGPPLIVRTAPIQAGALAQPDLTGTVVAQNQSALGFQVGGRIAARLVERGAVVSAGDVLARLDPAELAARVTASEAQWHQIEAQVRFAQQNYQRLQSLLAKKLASQQDFDQASSVLKAAQAGQNAALAQLDQARLALGYTELKAPFDGTVVALQADRGDVVSSGQPVLTLAAQGAPQVLVDVPAQRLVDLPKQAEAQAFGSETLIAATYFSTEGAADPHTRTWAVRYQLVDSARIRLGQTVTLHFPAQQAMKTVPIGAVQGEGHHGEIFVVRDGKVHRTPVTVTRLESDRAVIDTPLPIGTPVVAVGINRLHDGEAVRVQPGLGS